MTPQPTGEGPRRSTRPRVRAAGALSTARELEAALDEVAHAARTGLDGAAPDLVVVFATHHHGGGLTRVGRSLADALDARALFGCTGSWVAGGAREAENEAGLALLALTAPGARIRVRRIAPDDHAPLAFDDAERAGVLLLGDPFTFPTQDWLARHAEAHPEVPVVGGLASGGVAPGQNLLYDGREVVREGALALALEGDVQIEPAVSQACRPVGPPLVVTQCEGNVLLKVRGKPAAREIARVLEELDGDERALLEHGTFLGRAVDATKDHFEADDLLARVLIGVDPQRESVAVADDSLRAGQTVQLMVRDAEFASDDLGTAARRAAARLADRSRAALLFTCGGRGRGTFGRDDHDASTVVEAFQPDLPLAGFATNGEIGPTGGAPSLHSFTASVAFLAERG